MNKILSISILLFLLPLLVSAQLAVPCDSPINDVSNYRHKGGSVPKYEYRAVWLTTIENLDWPRTVARDAAGAERQKTELVAILDSLQALNVNMVLLQTRVRGDVIYPSAIEPFARLFTGVAGKSPMYDPLAFAIDECHKRGMQLHAWIVTLPVGKDDYVRRQGKGALPRRRPDLCTHFKGQWYMEPGNPATAGYIVSLVDEIVRNYDVDGIHLDYVRYPDRTDGYPDASLYRKHGKGLTLAQWRRENITRIAREVYNCVKEIKPWVRVSCAPLGKYSDLTRYSSLGWNARDAVYQDAQAWMREGIMDALFPMLYFNGNNFYPFVLDWQQNAYGRHIVPGIGVYRVVPEYGGWSPVEISRQLYTSRAAGTAGSIMFRTEHLLDEKNGAKAVYKSANSMPALVPPMSWGKGSAPSAPQLLSVNRNDRSVAVSWYPVEPNEDEPAVRYNVYGALGDSVDTGDISNLLASGLTECSIVWNCRTFRALALAVTTVDAYGRESEPLVVNSGDDEALPVKELCLPDQPAWGARVEVLDIYGRKVYKGKYSKRVDVRKLKGGRYQLRMCDRHGALLYSRWFKVSD